MFLLTDYADLHRRFDGLTLRLIRLFCVNQRNLREKIKSIKYCIKSIKICLIRSIRVLKLLRKLSNKKTFKQKNPTMKQLFTLLILCLSLSYSQAQERFFLVNGNAFNFKIKEASFDKIKYDQPNGDRIFERSWRRENILLITNAKGGYIMMTDITTDIEASKKQLEAFYNAPAPKKDILIKARPMTVIACEISYESDELVNYNLSPTTTGTIGKNELALILRRDGTQDFTQDVTESISILKAATTEAKRLAQSDSVVVIPKPDDPKPDDPKLKPVIDSTPTTVLTEEEKDVYKKESIQRVDDFVQYIGLITDKTANSDQKSNAVAQALKLFLPDSDIEVSDKNGNIKKYKIREYLKRLQILPYGKTKVEWGEVQYVKNLTLQADGSYLGKIRGVQTFVGFDPTDPSKAVFTNMTKKNVLVKLEAQTKEIEGKEQVKFQVLLGNIAIEVEEEK